MGWDRAWQSWPSDVLWGGDRVDLGQTAKPLLEHQGSPLLQDHRPQILSRNKSIPSESASHSAPIRTFPPDWSLSPAILPLARRSACPFSTTLKYVLFSSSKTIIEIQLGKQALNTICILLKKSCAYRNQASIMKAIRNAYNEKIDRSLHNVTTFSTSTSYSSTNSSMQPK